MNSVASKLLDKTHALIDYLLFSYLQAPQFDKLGLVPIFKKFHRACLRVSNKAGAKCDSTLSRGSPSLALGPILPRNQTSIHAAFAKHAAAHPSLPAVCHLEVTLTYQRLDLLSNGLATHLRHMGIQHGHRVLLLVSRSVEMVVGILGALRAGAAYVPLDGGIVTDITLETIIDDARPSVILCITKFVQRVKAMNVPVLDIVDFMQEHDGETSIADLEDTTQLSDEAYVIYTSGTTGRPKGVSVSHGNITNLILMHPGNLSIRPGACVSQILNIAFDMAAWEILGCLSNGGTLLMRSSGTNCASWGDVLKQVDVMICTPSILAHFDPREFQNIKVIATAGERCSQKLADDWAAGRTFWNCCGPTETTIINTAHLHSPGAPNMIGVPTPNNSVYVLDSALRPVPVGEPGLLWAGGAGVCKGYVNLPELVKDKFRPDLFSPFGGVMYNTGDIGRLCWNGELEHLGRKDEQVKIKGFRVELDGVAAAISSYPGISSAAAMLIDDELWGFFAPSNTAAEHVRKAVNRVQPYYARPKFFVPLERMPLTTNGKVNKKTLEDLARATGRKEKVPVM